jgi:hypothetical protein
MTTPDRDLPAANRADSEIDFVLRRAKWRRGPEILRDLARAQSAEKLPPGAEHQKPRKRAQGSDST